MRTSRSLASLVVLAAVVLGLAVGSPTAQAVERGSIGAHPAEGGDWVRRSILPGGSTEGAVVVSNTGRVPERVEVYVADAQATPQGGFSLRGRDERSVGLGTWLSLDQSSVTLPAQSTTTVRWRLLVPQATSPGEYAGGIVVERRPVHDPSLDLSGDTNVRLDVIERLAVRFYATVAGKREPRLATGELAWEPDARGGTFTFPVANVGNVKLRPQGFVRVRNQSGADATLRFEGGEELLPGQSARLAARWHRPPAVVWASATAVVESEAGTVSDATRMRVVPWGPLSGIGVGALFAAVVLRRACRWVGRVRRGLRLLPG